MDDVGKRQNDVSRRVLLQRGTAGVEKCSQLYQYKRKVTNLFGEQTGWGKVIQLCL